MSKITVIGAGNGGMAMAYSLGKSGHEVCIYDQCCERTGWYRSRC